MPPRAACNPMLAGAPPQGGSHAVLLLAWALLKDATASPGSPLAAGAASPGPAGGVHRGGAGAGGAQQLLEEAGRGGALGALGAMLRSTAFQLDGDADHRAVCAGVAYRLMCQLLAFDAAAHSEVMRSLVRVSDERARGGAPPGAAPGTPPAGAGAASPLALVPAGAPGGAPQDDMAALLRCLAAVFAAAPGLWVDEIGGERHLLVATFMSHVSRLLGG